MNQRTYRNIFVGLALFAIVGVLAVFTANAYSNTEHPPTVGQRWVAKLPTATASWFFDAGATASGRHYQYGFAALFMGSDWGHKVFFCHGRRCVVGQLEDHGPYVSGRLFDLNPALKAALGCGDLCDVHYRVRR